MSPQSELFKSLLRLLFCRWMDRTTTHYKGKGRCANSVIDWQYQDTRRSAGAEISIFLWVFSAPQSNNQKTRSWRGWRLFTSVCFVCRAVVNTFSACSFSDLTSHSSLSNLYTVRTVCARSYRGTVAAAASAKTREKGYCSVDSKQTMLHW